MLQQTKNLLSVFPRKEKIQASKVIDLMIGYLNLNKDATDIAMCILYALHNEGYLEYHRELFTADYVIMN